MNALRWFALSCLLLTFVVAGCGGAKPKDQIVGKWENKDKVAEMEIVTTLDFQKDGTLVQTLAGAEVKGKYAFTSDDTFEIINKVGDKDMKTISKVEKIDAEKFVIADEKGGKKEYKKVK